jgi:hypothetical protein
MRTRLTALAATALLAVPAGATTPLGGPVPDTPVAHRVSVPGAAVTELLDRGDVVGAVIESLVAVGGDAVALRALAEDATAEHLLAAPDLDGDRLADVIGMARAGRPGQSLADAAEELVVTGRRGVNGTPLWLTTVPGSVGILVADASELLVVSTEVTAARVALTLTSLDLDGTVRWSRTDQGLNATSFVNLPIYRGRMTGPGGDVQHLVLLWDLAFIDTSRTPSRATALILDGDDGDVLGTVSQSSPEQVTYAHPAGDVDGDGQDEVAITRAAVFGTRGTIAAHTIDGDQLWQTEAPFRSNGYLEVADATGDSREDLAVGFDAGTVALLDGGAGAIGWERPGDVPAVLGDIDRDGLVDIGVRTVGGTSQTLELDHAAYRGDGRQLYGVTRAVTHPFNSFTSTTTTYLTGSDADGDGIRDTTHGYEVRAESGGGTLFDGGPTSGATGLQLWTAEDTTTPEQLNGSVTGRAGADFARIRQAGSGAFIEIFDGAHGEPVWSRVVGAGQFDTSTVSVADLDGDGRGEVLLTLFGTDSTLAATTSGFVLDGNDGSVRWNGAP